MWKTSANKTHPGASLETRYRQSLVLGLAAERPQFARVQRGEDSRPSLRDSGSVEEGLREAQEVGLPFSGGQKPEGTCLKLEPEKDARGGQPGRASIPGP